jgi:hypothetical protein
MGSRIQELVDRLRTLAAQKHHVKQAIKLTVYNIAVEISRLTVGEDVTVNGWTAKAPLGAKPGTLLGLEFQKDGEVGIAWITVTSIWMAARETYADQHSNS